MIMRLSIRALTIAGLGFAVIAGPPGVARAADPDWKAVEQARGNPAR